MQFMTSLFGASGNTMLNAVFALGIVLALIVLGLWALKLVSRAGSSIGQTRKRVVVVETVTVDGKRRAVIIRRDNIEHLILTGGPQDLVIESGIPVPEQPVPTRRPRAAEAAAARAAHAAQPGDIATPPAQDGSVPREAVDRLGDLARPAPLRPRPGLRHTALLRPVTTDSVIPIAGERRGDNSPGS